MRRLRPPRGEDLPKASWLLFRGVLPVPEREPQSPKGSELSSDASHLLPPRGRGMAGLRGQEDPGSDVSSDT